MSLIIKIENLSFSYQDRLVLKDLSFNLSAGDYLALAGPNGAGKTTLVKNILGLESFNQGSLELFDTPLNSFKEWGKIAYLPQKHQYNPLFPASVFELVLSGANGLDKTKRQEAKNKALSLLQELGLAQEVKVLFSRLSGGQQQRVLLARALIREPELLILDEPTTALDPQVREKFFAILKRYNEDKGTAIIMVTHDTADIGRYAKKLCYLDQEIIFYGDFHEFCHSQKMKDYFGNFSQHLICHQH
jgi:zinc transport system ATP-binding protein